MKKILAVLFAFFALIGFTSCDENTPTVEETPSEIVEYTVNFESNGGTSINTLTIESGLYIIKPVDPVKDGYTFGGWFKDEACTQEFKFDTDVVTSNLTLYAKWTEKIEEITIAEALEICASLADGETSESRYQITGTIDSIDNPSYGQMTISDETGTISVYGTYSADGELRYSELEDKPYAGDTVVLSALLQNYKGNAEISNGRILSFVHNEIEVNEEDYTQMSIDAARNTEKGTLVKVSGVVARITYADGYVPSGFYLVDGTNSIYVYDGQIAPRVEIGNTVTVIGKKDAWILDSETNNAAKFGYKGCNQISNAYLISNDNGNTEYDKSWIEESTVKEIMDTPVTEDITTTIFKVNALVTKAEGTGFVNYYFNDIDGKTGTYTYTQCSGGDFAWLDEFDGKICTVYLSVINAKSNPAGCIWRFFPVSVVYENYTFDLNDSAEYAVEYVGIDQFKPSYTGDPELELVTSVSSELLGITNATLSYASSNENVVYFEVVDGVCKMHTKDAGTVTVTITGSYGEKTYSNTVEIVVEEAPDYVAVTVKEAIDATFDTLITVKGIAGPSLVNQVGFYLIDETGVIAIKTDTATMESISFGQEVVMMGTRKRYVKEEKLDVCFGQSCLLDSVLVANLYGNHEYSTATFDTTKDLEYIYNLDELTDFTTMVYVVEAEVSVVETAFYTNILVVSGDISLRLYSASANQYNWLKVFAGQTVTLEIAPCNWNGKDYYTGCVLSATGADGVKTFNKLNYTA